MSSEEVAFQMILYGGNARSCAMEAIQFAKSAQLAEAKEKLAEAGAEMTKAHHIQTRLIQEEAGGEKKEISLLTVHAQDHLMNAFTIKDMAQEFVDLYESIHRDAGGGE